MGLNKLPTEEVVYGVYDSSGKLLHLGEGAGIERPAQYVANIRKSTPLAYAKYELISPSLKQNIGIPGPLVGSKLLYRGNLERLLQAAHILAQNSLPSLDRLRGKGGSELVGGFVDGEASLRKMFLLFDDFFGAGQNWPTSFPPMWIQELKSPLQKNLYPVFWSNIKTCESFVGFIRTISKDQVTPHYKCVTEKLTWKI